MKYLLLGGLAFLAFTAQATTMDQASRFVNDTLNQGQQIINIKSDVEKTREFCALVNANVDIQSIADAWLGKFADLSTDKAGISDFRSAVPSILVGKLEVALTRGGGTFTVDPTSTDLGNGTIEVDLTIDTARGNTYNGKAIVVKSGGAYKVIDAQYAAFSAVDYLGQDYQKRLEDAAIDTPDTPVTELVKELKSANDYKQCP